MTLTIVTNNHARPLVALCDLPRAAMADFDYIEPIEHDVPRLFQYRGAWYDVHEFTRITKRSQSAHAMCHGVDDDSPLLAWHGIQGDTYFSGTLVKLLDGNEGEYVIVGRCYS